MKENWKSYLAIAIIVGAFVSFNLFYKGPSDEDFKEAGISVLNESNKDILMSDSDIPVMVLFKTNTCNVCKVFAPKFIDFAKKNKDKARYVVADPNNIDFDRYGIRAYPTTRIYYQGRILEELVGNGSIGPFQKIIDSIK